VPQHLELWQWALLCLGAFCIGLAKTGFGGLGLLAIIIFSNVIAPRESVGLVLVLLICADVVAVSAFRRHAVWSHLWPLFPWTIAGVVLGYLAMGRVDDQQVRKLIGGILVALVLLQFRQFFRKEQPRIARHDLPFVALMGLAAGFTTMVANAAGPIMIIYLLAAGLPKLEFVGTGAWYFLLMNCFKVPFSWSLGLINPASLSIDFVLAPFAVAGALSGQRLLPYIKQRLFEGLALSATLLAALRMIW
jgi:uncharacterized membrane protein YfcA